MIFLKVILTVVMIFQMAALGGLIMTDLTENFKKQIQSKRDVLKFFIPFFWLVPLINGTVKWWNNLK